eukprot:13467267-Alexandrium_andersonii.AAC.1
MWTGSQHLRQRPPDDEPQLRTSTPSSSPDFRPAGCLLGGAACGIRSFRSRPRRGASRRPPAGTHSPSIQRL